MNRYLVFCKLNDEPSEAIVIKANYISFRGFQDIIRRTFPFIKKEDSVEICGITKLDEAEDVEFIIVGENFKAEV